MRLLALVLGIGLALFGGAMLMVTLIGAADGMDVFVTGFFGVVTLAGLLLMEFGSPGLWGRAARGTSQLVTRPATLLNPIAQAIIGAVIEVTGMTLLLREGEGGIVVFAVTMAYTIACPIAIALRSGWFLNAVLASVGMVGLLFVVPAFTEMGLGRQVLGESAMLLMLPAMIFPCALVLSGILRLIIARRAQPASPAA